MVVILSLLVTTHKDVMLSVFRRVRVLELLLPIVDILWTHIPSSGQNGLLEASIHGGVHLNVVGTGHLRRNVSLSVIVGLVSSLLGAWQHTVCRQHDGRVGVLRLLLLVFIHRWGQGIVPLDHVHLESDWNILGLICLLFAFNWL